MKLTDDEFRTLGARKWEIEKHLDAWDRNGIRPPAYAELKAERDRIILALQGGDASTVIGDTIRPEVCRLARNIAAAVERLGDELVAASDFANIHANVDGAAQHLLKLLEIPAAGDPRNPKSVLRQWVDTATREGLIPR